MNWFIRTLGGAIIAGVGWKLGSEAYDFVKKRFEESQGGAEEEADEGAGAQATEVGAAVEDGTCGARA